MNTCLADRWSKHHRLRLCLGRCLRGGSATLRHSSIDCQLESWLRLCCLFERWGQSRRGVVLLRFNGRVCRIVSESVHLSVGFICLLDALRSVVFGRELLIRRSFALSHRWGGDFPLQFFLHRLHVSRYDYGQICTSIDLLTTAQLNLPRGGNGGFLRLLRRCHIRSHLLHFGLVDFGGGFVFLGWFLLFGRLRFAFLGLSRQPLPRTRLS